MYKFYDLHDRRPARRLVRQEQSLGRRTLPGDGVLEGPLQRLVGHGLPARLCARPAHKNGVLRTRPPVPTSNVTKLIRSLGPSEASMKSSVFLMTRCFSAAVEGVALGGGREITRIRSIGGCAIGERELDGPDDK